MDLHYLKIFYEVAKEKSFTKAASKLYINQSAVSIQVKKFEEILNAKLFDRSSKKIKLTYTGEALYKMAEDIFDKVKRAEKEISRIIDLDILIIDEEHINDPNLEVITIEKMPYVLVSTKEYHSMESVAKDPLITRRNIPNNNEAIAAIEDKYRVTFSSKINVNGSLEVIKGMVREEIGNVILPYYSVHKEIEKGEFKVIYKVNDVKDGYQAVITKDKKSLIQIIKFINFIQDYKIQY